MMMDRRSAERLGDSVRKAEHLQYAPTGKIRQRVANTRLVVVRILSHSGSGVYTCKVVRLHKNSAADYNPVPFSDDTENWVTSVTEINGREDVPIDSNVVAQHTFASEDADLNSVTGNWYWVFEYISSKNGLFAVNVSQVGGSAGNASAACSFTYNVTDLDSVLLASGVSPTWNRTSAGKMVAATHGTGYYDSAGDFVLYQVDEVPDVASC